MQWVSVSLLQQKYYKLWLDIKNSAQIPLPCFLDMTYGMISPSDL